MSLELQPGCNLQCGHCATHGTPQAHKHNNRLGAIDAAKLEALASEVFPHMTLLHLVGRGEPLMVSDKLWSQLVNEVIRNRLLLTIVTNGHFVERRITPDVMPSIDTLTVSIDGFSPDVFASNRGGASFERVIQGVRYYHELRKSISLPRRPKLCISWTLKRNNIEELPDFIRYIAQFEPDRFYMRHLLVCHDKDESESLLNYPDLSNRYLSEAYDLFVKMGIETDCPPLMSSTSAGKIKPAASVAEDDLEVQQSILQRGESCHYIHRTASLNASGRMTTCGIYHAKLVGTFNEESSFSSLWNGEVMRCVRRDINTPNEWDQCAKCWFRQSRYRSQRAERAKVSSFSLKNEAKFTKGAWDYRSPKRKSTSDIALVLDEQITHSL
jgi:MoaA/NifB/PqqE/SkfB family radical SAM enzyme